MRYTVYDAEDNFDQLTATYFVDKNPPQIVQNLIINPGYGTIMLTWQPVADADVNKYIIYRSLSKDGEYTKIGEVTGRTNVVYTDKNLQIGQTYYYRVTAVDNFGQESNPSNVVVGSALADSVPPVVLGIEPLDSTVLGKTGKITVRAEDNLELSSITLQYSIDEEKWIDIETKNTKANAVFEITLPELNGNISIRAIARDAAGNESDGTPVRTYVVDQQGPAQVTGFRATAGASSVTLHWSDVPDNDFSYFKVERKDTVDGDFKSVGTTNTTLGMIVTGLEPDTTYWFRVVAYDRYDNRGEVSETLQVSTTSDAQSPVITSLRPKPGEFSTDINISGTASDNIGVTSFTFQMSRDMDTWIDVKTFTPSSVQKTVTFSHTIDVTDKEEGPLYIRALAMDAAGNVSDTSDNAPYVEHRIDHTSPLNPANFAVSAETGYISLRWDQGTETDLAYYKVYRSETENGEYAVVADKLKYISYNDRDVEPEKQYYYKVVAVDVAGNESVPTQIISAQPTPDTESPEIISFYPAVSSTLPANPVISVLAADNYKLSKIITEYKKEASAEWVQLGVKESNKYSEAVTFDWNTDSLTDGNYVVRAIAVDQEGNTSEALTANYVLNIDPPQAPVVSAVPGGWKIDLSWTSGRRQIRWI